MEILKMVILFLGVILFTIGLIGISWKPDKFLRMEKEKATFLFFGAGLILLIIALLWNSL